MEYPMLKDVLLIFPLVSIKQQRSLSRYLYLERRLKVKRIG